MQFTNGWINVFLLVLERFSNILIIYRIFHFGDGKTWNLKLMMWSLENYIIHKLLLLLVGLIIVLNCICLMALRLFSGSYFIAHTHYLRGIWHEWFGHVNYRYLQQLRKLNLLLGVPKPSCTDGVCLGVVLGKQQ